MAAESIGAAWGEVWEAGVWANGVWSATASASNEITGGTPRRRTIIREKKLREEFEEYERRKELEKLRKVDEELIIIMAMIG